MREKERFKTKNHTTSLRLFVINPIHRKRFPFPVWEGEFKISLTHRKKVLHAFLWDKNNNI